MDCEWCGDGEEGRVWTVSGVMGRVWTVSDVMGRRGGWTEWCVWCVMCYIKLYTHECM